LKLSRQFLTDDEDDVPKSAPDGIEYGVVEQPFSGRTERLKLLGAAIAGSGAGRHHDQCQKGLASF
jgi:hypothetical protein